LLKLNLQTILANSAANTQSICTYRHRSLSPAKGVWKHKSSLQANSVRTQAVPKRLTFNDLTLGYHSTLIFSLVQSLKFLVRDQFKFLNFFSLTASSTAVKSLIILHVRLQVNENVTVGLDPIKHD